MNRVRKEIYPLGMTRYGYMRLCRVETWCARCWAESADAAKRALAASNSLAYQRWRQDEKEWLSALLVVNRLTLGIEPNEGRDFIPELAQVHARQG